MAKILLAEDDDSLRGFLVNALKRAGHVVKDFDEGRTALKALEREVFDLLLTDIVMPGLDGIELARRGAEADPAMKIVFITGFAAVALSAQSAAELVVVHFPHGCVAAARDGTVAIQPAVRVPREEIAGSNGAGDAFAAGILLGMHEKWPLADSLALAHASAAVSLRSITTNGSVENWKACLALAERWGWRETPA
jgi:two-component system cell cycle response regulator CpdR